MHEVAEILCVLKPVAQEWTERPPHVEVVQRPEGGSQTGHEKVSECHIRVVEVDGPTTQVSVTKYEEDDRARAAYRHNDEKYIGDKEERCHHVLHHVLILGSTVDGVLLNCHCDQFRNT